MTDFTNLAALVAQGQSLLDLVKGGHITQLEADNAAKLGEVDAALAAKIAQANTDIANAVAPIDGKITHSLLTKNNCLIVSSGTVPDDVIAPLSSTFSIVDFIAWAPANRDAGQVALLTQIETDIKGQFADFDIRSESFYFNNFNVIQIDWDFGAGFSGEDYLMQLGKVASGGGAGNAIFTSSELTSHALIKLVSGTLADKDLGKGTLLGEWRYSNSKVESGDLGFGGYVNTFLRATSQTGSLLIALPSTVTGLVSHPKDIHF